ncbi:hypothetical protein EXIGLDRAFT_241289 [Exidia glandulosa HHB12029]|uniref:Uncharacterized protein n=1 Tax=Exidia glandulosa HHB12029 TaxID=1314781 RepID=A0A165Q6W1_EXIGL|nr:hypothetical protein EXIGLDRAFT_241289 [Exidia glandulosa HHB12029]
MSYLSFLMQEWFVLRQAGAKLPVLELTAYCHRVTEPRQTAKCAIVSSMLAQVFVVSITYYSFIPEGVVQPASYCTNGQEPRHGAIQHHRLVTSNGPRHSHR